MNLFESEEALENALRIFLVDHRMHLGLVSLRAPLISNLPVWSNITLIRQYHENMPWEKAKAWVMDILQRFGMAATAEKRNPFLTAEERFCIMLIRAAMVRNAIVCLDRPFRLLPNNRNKRFLMDALRKVDDLIAEVHIFDYSWEQERYGTNVDAEN